MPSYCGKRGAEQVAQRAANNAQAEANAAAAEFLRDHGQYVLRALSSRRQPFTIAEICARTLVVNYLESALSKLGSGTDPDDRKEAGGG